MSEGRLVTIGGKRWRLRYCDIRAADGECDAPDTPHKEIRIAQSLRKNVRALTETLIHETIHAGAWLLDEGAVEQVAADITKILDYEGCLRKESQ